MRKLLLLLLFPLLMGASVHEAQYGVAETFPFELYTTAGVLDVDEADGGAEVSISCDQGAETTATNDFVDEGTFYSIALTATEMECSSIVVVVAATDTNLFYINTFGDLNAQSKSEGVASGTAQSGTGTTIVLDATTSIADDFLNNHVIVLTGGTGAGQTRHISDWVSSTDTVTVSAAWTTNPASGTEYIVQSKNQGLVTCDANGYCDVNVVEIETLDPTDTLNAQADLAISDANLLIVPEALVIDAVEYTADSGSISTLVDAALNAADDGYYRDATLHFTGGQANISGQTACVNNFTASSDTISFSPAVTQAVAAGATYYLTFGGCERGR